MKKLYVVVYYLGLIISVLFYFILAYRWAKKCGKIGAERDAYEFDKLWLCGGFVLALSLLHVSWIVYYEKPWGILNVTFMTLYALLYWMFGYFTLWKIPEMHNRQVFLTQ